MHQQQAHSLPSLIFGSGRCSPPQACLRASLAGSLEEILRDLVQAVEPSAPVSKQVWMLVRMQFPGQRLAHVSRPCPTDHRLRLKRTRGTVHVFPSALVVEQGAEREDDLPNEPIDPQENSPYFSAARIHA